MRKVFIQTNDKQRFGALIARFAIMRGLPAGSDLSVELVNVDELEVFDRFAEMVYLRNGSPLRFDPKDLQSFTLSRFMPPELMGYEGRALVIDPDIFALTDVTALFELDLRGKAIGCCPKSGFWDTSMMVLECEQLRHWSIETLMEGLSNKELDYSDVISLKKERLETIQDLPRKWNSLDHVDEQTEMVHMTNRLTQPWKTGLPIDFTRNKMPRIFGLFPREPVHRVLGKYPSNYQPHPNKELEDLFVSLVTDALDANVISRDLLEEEMERSNVRGDLLSMIEA